jgi:hypothetical protein
MLPNRAPERHNDEATTSVIENWIDETELRTWSEGDDPGVIMFEKRSPMARLVALGRQPKESLALSRRD